MNIGRFLEFTGQVFITTEFFEEAREEGLWPCIVTDLAAEGPSLASSSCISCWLTAPGSLLWTLALWDSNKVIFVSPHDPLTFSSDKSFQKNVEASRLRVTNRFDQNHVAINIPKRMPSTFPTVPASVCW